MRCRPDVLLAETDIALAQHHRPLMPAPSIETSTGSLSAQAVVAGLLSGFVGFAGAFAIVLQGLTAAGATPAQAASGLLAVSVAMGLAGILLSLRTRMPISAAWSTPGAALLASTGAVEGGFPAAVGAFLLCGALMVAVGLFKPLGRAIAALPPALANAMLAGVLLGLCLAPARAVAQFPAVALSLVLVWAVVARIKRLLAVPAAVLALLAVMALWPQAPLPSSSDLWPRLELVTPVFTVQAAVGIALPLFLVTMASQNIPGMAVLNANGYKPAPGPLFTVTGLFTLLAAPFGGHAVNLAAITAAICANPEAHPDPSRRYWAAVFAGLTYIAFGLTAGAATAFIATSPPVLIEAVAGLALLGAFAGAILNAVRDEKDREAAVVTFLVTASGLSFLGIGGAFWGLIAGGVLLGFDRWRDRVRRAD
jgi:benzoate membrane transport protein